MKLIFRMLFFICLLPSFAYGYMESHYVTQNGNGAKTGRSLSNAWAVSQFNNSANWSANVAVDGKIGPNDVVYFSGAITTRLDLKGSGSAGYPITLDGYEAGDCNPIANGSCPGATSTGGLENTQANHYLTFQDFNITTNRWDFLKRSSESTNLKWLRNNWDNTSMNHLTASVSDGRPVGSYWWFEGNRFGNYALNSDPPGGVNFGDVHHLVMRGNYFTGHNGIARSSNMIEFHECSNVLIEYNHLDPITNQGNSGMIVPKEMGNQNFIIRFNKFITKAGPASGSDETALAVNWPTSTQFFIYGNYFNQESYYASGNLRMSYAMQLYDAVQNVNVWSNIVTNYNQAGIALWWRSNSHMGVPDSTRIKNIKFYNNTIVGNGGRVYSGKQSTGLSIDDSSASGFVVKNNLFANNRSTQSDRLQIYNTINNNLTLEHNTYFHSGGQPVVHHFGVDRTIATLQSSYQREDDSPAGVVANPGLSTNMTLNGTHINNGANLSGLAGSLTIHGTKYDMYWQTALHPSTDWSGQPSESKIITVDQNAYAAWQRGAYVYDKDIKITPPLGVTVTPY